MRYRLIEASATIQDASAAMRDCHADALVVVDASGVEPHASAVIFATDIVTRIVALGLDARVLTVSDLLDVLELSAEGEMR